MHTLNMHQLQGQSHDGPVTPQPVLRCYTTMQSRHPNDLQSEPSLISYIKANQRRTRPAQHMHAHCSSVLRWNRQAGRLLALA